MSWCWVCTELPVSLADGLAWSISPATQDNWMWWEMANQTTAEWEAVLWHVEKLLHQDMNLCPPWFGYALCNGWAWLPVEHVELWSITPKCIKQKGDPKRLVGEVPLNLCNTTQVLVGSFRWWNGQPYVRTKPTDRLLAGYLWVSGPHGWPYIPANWSGCYTWGHPFIPGHIVSTLDQKYSIS